MMTGSGFYFEGQGHITQSGFEVFVINVHLRDKAGHPTTDCLGRGG